MQPALQEKKEKKETEESSSKAGDTTMDLARRYPGCVFNYSMELKDDDDEGFWFDFMADCGEYHFKGSKNN
jgi:hypothetical protein